MSKTRRVDRLSRSALAVNSPRAWRRAGSKAKDSCAPVLPGPQAQAIMAKLDRKKGARARAGGVCVGWSAWGRLPGLGRKQRGMRVSQKQIPRRARRVAGRTPGGGPRHGVFSPAPSPGHDLGRHLAHPTETPCVDDALCPCWVGRVVVPDSANSPQSWPTGSGIDQLRATSTVAEFATDFGALPTNSPSQIGRGSVRLAPLRNSGQSRPEFDQLRTTSAILGEGFLTNSARS